MDPTEQREIGCSSDCQLLDQSNRYGWGGMCQMEKGRRMLASPELDRQQIEYKLCDTNNV